jgi:diguanylate cyclase (GGDEF)-like protein
VESYRAVLKAIGKGAVGACPAPGRDLDRALTGLEGQLSVHATPDAVKRTRQLVTAALERWSSSTAAHLKGKADEVKELLIMLARTAESVGKRNERYVTQFTGLTADLEAIADLDDLTLIRSSLIKKARELKSCVDQMAQDGAQSLEQLRSKVSDYEDKIETVEQLALEDALTGVANRRGVEARMELNMSEDRPFCVVILDLDQFKLVNDKYGHVAGDDLLKKFAQELRTSVRVEDLVGRWGGDEFMVVLNRDMAGARAQIERIREWVFGDYTIETGADKATQKICIAASVGLAQWRPDRTLTQVIELADAAMYQDKKERREKSS